MGGFLSAKFRDILAEHIFFDDASPLVGIVHFVWRGNLRYNRVPIDNTVAVLTPHFVHVFKTITVTPMKRVPKPSNKTEKGQIAKAAEFDEVPDPSAAFTSLELLAKFLLKKLTTIAHSTRNLLLKTKQHNIILKSDETRHSTSASSVTETTNSPTAMSTPSSSSVPT
jgi:hypothetical protein